MKFIGYATIEIESASRIDALFKCEEAERDSGFTINLLEEQKEVK